MTGVSEHIPNDGSVPFEDIKQKEDSFIHTEPIADDFTHTAKSIIDLLGVRFSKGTRFKIANAYIFHDWETDYFVVQYESEYCYDIEVKISRADFFADFKKINKHSILSEGTYKRHSYQPVLDDMGNRVKDAGGYTEYTESYTTAVCNFRPNKFYYCVPEGLIKPSEVPEYAGLMYARRSDIYTVKEAKFIHKKKLKFDAKLCDKMYSYWVKAKDEMFYVSNDLKYQQRINSELKKENEMFQAFYDEVAEQWHTRQGLTVEEVLAAIKRKVSEIKDYKYKP